ncbi:hypothetical protein LZ31DRAFT_620220 [Colletotrichum somersetense]|nr:hypothetical protein LZ31DRAFT_620220 [Colletotrichum somersetense]
MTMGGVGPRAIAIMWSLTAVVALFSGARLYTRMVIKAFGTDDVVYNLAFVLLCFYTLFTTISAHYGFGQNMNDIQDPDHQAMALLFEAIGQTFAVVGMAVAKCSLGLFLLRLVPTLLYKWIIWISMLCLLIASFSTCLVFWFQCSPPRYLWDRETPGGHCPIDSTPVSLILCVLCVIVDFLYAALPWFFIWTLQMSKKEKGTILLSLSLGVIAGVCGIKRTLEVPSLSSHNYLKDTVYLIVWSGAEIAVTMICIAIPVCRPLYNQYIKKSTIGKSSGYKRQGDGLGLALDTIGGTPFGDMTAGRSRRTITNPSTDTVGGWSRDECDLSPVHSQGGSTRQLNLPTAAKV